jgi:hypothetical protein
MSEDRRYPLHWPSGWTRTEPNRRQRSKYKVSEEAAKRDLIHSLKLLGASSVILSTNVRLRNDGLPYASQSRVEDPGVAVYFVRKGQDQVIACDKWDLIGDNFRGVGLAVESLRQLERCGASEILDRAFTGFAALPPGGGSPNWRLELGIEVPWPLTADEVQAAFREVAKRAHPDKGGSSEWFRRVVAARDAGLAEANR